MAPRLLLVLAPLATEVLLWLGWLPCLRLSQDVPSVRIYLSRGRGIAWRVQSLTFPRNKVKLSRGGSVGTYLWMCFALVGIGCLVLSWVLSVGSCMQSFVGEISNFVDASCLGLPLGSQLHFLLTLNHSIDV